MLRARKAFLLSAGKGSRLRPLTDHRPKCLLPVGDLVPLDVWLVLLKRAGVEEVLVNIHEHRDLMLKHVAGHVGPPKITVTFEEDLLGTAGTVKANKGFVYSEELFWVCYSDNLTNIRLSLMQEFHLRTKGIMTVAVYPTSRPRSCGIVELDDQSRMISFIEKPDSSQSNLANSGIYLCTPDMFEYFPNGKVIDFGLDVLPKLIMQTYAYLMQEFIIDIGTHENYRYLVRNWSSLKNLLDPN